MSTRPPIGERQSPDRIRFELTPIMAEAFGIHESTLCVKLRDLPPIEFEPQMRKYIKRQPGYGVRHAF